MSLSDRSTRRNKLKQTKITDYFPYVRRGKYDKMSFKEKCRGNWPSTLLPILLRHMTPDHYVSVRSILRTICKTWDCIVEENDKAKDFLDKLWNRRVNSNRCDTPIDKRYPTNSDFVTFLKHSVSCDLPLSECHCGCIGPCEGEMYICKKCLNYNCNEHTWECNICNEPYCQSSLNHDCIGCCDKCGVILCDRCNEQWWEVTHCEMIVCHSCWKEQFETLCAKDQMQPIEELPE